MLHEYAHAIWHKILGEPEKKSYEEIAPQFYPEIPEDGYGYVRATLSTLQGDEKASEFYTRKSDAFVSDQARNKISDEFAESFTWYKVDPDWFKVFAPARAHWFNGLSNILSANKIVEKSALVLEGGEAVVLGDVVDPGLQLTDSRRYLALQAEEVLTDVLADQGKVLNDVVWIVSHGEFIHDGTPKSIDLIVLTRGGPEVSEFVEGPVHLWITGDSGKADRLVHEYTSPRIVGKPRFAKILQNTMIKAIDPEQPDKILTLMDEVGFAPEDKVELMLHPKQEMWELLKHHGHDDKSLALVESNAHPIRVHVLDSAPEYVMKAVLLSVGNYIYFNQLSDEEFINRLDNWLDKSPDTQKEMFSKMETSKDEPLASQVKQFFAIGKSLSDAHKQNMLKEMRTVIPFIIYDKVIDESIAKRDLPKGHIDETAYVSTQDITTPIETHYSLGEHQAKRAGKHYDLRIALGDKAWSWSLRDMPKDKKKMTLAVLQPPHSIQYMKWEGIIPEGYGAGDVKINDARKIDITRWGERQKTFRVLSGPYKGHYNLIHWTGRMWLMHKKPEFRDPIIPQFHPHRLRAPVTEEMWENPRYIMQPKVDGARYLLYVGDKENRVLSRHRHESGRHVGKHVERTDNLPHIRDLQFPGVTDAVIDGEVFIKDQPTTTSVMGSDPDRSRMIQDKHGKPTYIAFDLLRLNGEDIRKMPYEQRLALLQKILPQNKYLRLTSSFRDNKIKQCRDLLNQGWEGIVFKDSQGKYTDNFSAKFKKKENWDFIVMGATPGTGKFEGQVGALELGRWDPASKSWVSAGRVGTGINDQTRLWLTQHMDELVNNKSVVQVGGMSTTKAGKVTCACLPINSHR